MLHIAGRRIQGFKKAKCSNWRIPNSGSLGLLRCSSPAGMHPVSKIAMVSEYNAVKAKRIKHLFIFPKIQ